MSRTVSNKLTVSELRKLVTLDPETGKLFWLGRDVLTGEPKTQRATKTFNTRYAGKEALTALNERGAKQGLINGAVVKAARVVWALTHGQWPEQDVCHRNGDLSDNRPSNLLLATRGKGPRAVRSDSLSGVKGVRFHQNRWNARLRVNGRLLHLGNYDTQQQAQDAVLQARAGRPVLEGRKVGSRSVSDKRKKQSA